MAWIIQLNCDCTVHLCGCNVHKGISWSLIRGLSGKYPAILNISITDHVASVYLGSQSEETYCASMNSHSPMGPVSRQWDSIDWACVMCDHRIHNDWASRKLHQDNGPAHSVTLVQAFLGQTSHHPSLSVCLQPRFGSLQLLVFPKAKISFASKEICDYGGHTVHKLSQRRLTANWLALGESDRSLMHSKVSSDWLPSYIKVTPTVLKIFKMAGYFRDSPHICKTQLEIIYDEDLLTTCPNPKPSTIACVHIFRHSPYLKTISFFWNVRMFHASIFSFYLFINSIPKIHTQEFIQRI
jgi:hypothetical protein